MHERIGKTPTYRQGIQCWQIGLIKRESEIPCYTTERKTDGQQVQKPLKPHHKGGNIEKWVSLYFSLWSVRPLQRLTLTSIAEERKKVKKKRRSKRAKKKWSKKKKSVASLVNSNQTLWLDYTKLKSSFPIRSLCQMHSVLTLSDRESLQKSIRNVWHVILYTVL